jgi:glycosyltransferase involved in cell wall biosynthesis
MQPSRMNKTTTSDVIRVGVQQPSLAKYRVPAFKELANRNEISLNVVYGDRKGVPNAQPEGFDGEAVSLFRSRMLGFPLYWHSPQLSLVSPRKNDVVILTWNVQYLTLIPALMRAKLNGVKTILWGHGYSKNESRWKLKLRSSVGNLADALLFYNQSTADQFIERGFNPAKIFVAPNSLDQTDIQRCRHWWLDDANRLKDFQEKHQPGSPSILFVSRLHEQNRLDLLIDVVCRLKDSYPGIRLNIVGSGDQEQQRLKELTRQRNLDTHVHFAGAIYEEMELAPWFLSADVFCYPSNIGLSLLHAFGYGVPVITTDDRKSQNPEIDAFSDQENGLFFHDDSAEDLERCISAIIENPAMRNEMSANALSTVTDRFNVERMVDGMVDAIKYCVRRRS